MPRKTTTASGVCRKSTLIRAFRKIGLAEGDILLVHSSLKSLGHVEGGPDTVIDALLACLGKSGTLMMPTFTGSPKDGPGHPPVFDVANTPGYTGLITETFRKRPGVVRSFHPTHSVAAIGSAAERYLEGHENAETPCGWETPFGRLIREGGKVLFIGATLESCTLFHSCEEFAAVDYHMQREPVTATILCPNGVTLHSRIRIHWWNADAPRDYPALEPLLIREGAMELGRAGRAPLRLLHAGLAHEITMRLLADDPTALLRGRQRPLL